MLTRKDGTVLAAYPPGARAAQPSRFAAARDIAAHDARVAFSIPDSHVQARWFSDAQRIGLASGASFIALTAAAGLALRQLRARQAALEALHHDVVIREATEEKLHDASRLEAVGRVAGGVAHDVNNLLTTVMMSLDLIEAGSRFDPAAAAHVAGARQASETGARLVASLLAYVRGQILSPVAIDAPALVDAMPPLLRNLVGRSITLARRDAPRGHDAGGRRGRDHPRAQGCAGAAVLHDRPRAAALGPDEPRGQCA